ncbi:MAG TPA: Uma2 family endonuclease [Vicinamibacterales bacterium]|nr:Uma2 family endonuclease [Vicinamibacterales bacterium]
MTTEQYLYDTEETNRIRELAMGVIREPAPSVSHQNVVLRLAMFLGLHNEANKVGQVLVAPVDVVLDVQKNLILQPDILVVRAERLSIVKDQVWGAPDLVIEVLSPSTAHYDRSEKFGWYRQYGVREYWLVDSIAREITIHDFTAGLPMQHTVRGMQRVSSTVVPDFRLRVVTLIR